MFGLGFGVGTITRPALTADAFGTAGFATIAALLGIALTAAKAAGPVIAGAMRTLAGDYTPVLLVAAVACLVAAAAVWPAGTPHDHPDDARQLETTGAA
jgi:hypothetical protein